MPTQKGGKEFETGLIIVKTDSSQRLGERERERERDQQMTGPWKVLERGLQTKQKNHQTPTYCMFIHSVFCLYVGTDQFFIFLY